MDLLTAERVIDISCSVIIEMYISSIDTVPRVVAVFVKFDIPVCSVKICCDVIRAELSHDLLPFKDRDHRMSFSG